MQTGAKQLGEHGQRPRPRSAATPRRRVIPKATISATSKRSLGEQLEQLLLLGVGDREAGLDHVHAELVERVHDAHLLLGRERHALPLPMPSRRVAS